LGDQIRADVKVFCEKTDFIDYQTFEKLIDTQPGAQVWYIYNFVLWWNEYIEVPQSHAEAA